MVAAFERYVKDAFEEYADEVARRAKSTGHPKLEKEFSECNDYNFVHWLIRESREKKVQKIVELRRIAKLIAVNGFIPEAFSRTRANPGPETLKELFKDFGVTDVFRVIEDNLKNHYPAPFASGFARSQLDAIIGWRNDVAHGGGALNMARADLERWVVFMGALGRAVDNTLRDRTLAVVAVL